MDYVAFIARQALRSTVGEEISVNKSTSGLEQSTRESSERFVFYVSFINEQQAIGMQLCEALNEFCQQNNLKDFKLHVRFSNKNKQRWDENFIRNALKENGIGPHDKVWACGPPPMSESFDRAFANIIKEEFQGLHRSNLYVF